jgi:pimeloyl-ACP methyl ester carboxylesterase
MAHHTLQLPSGSEIAYWIHHENKKPVLLLVHGFTGSHMGFQYLVPLLKDFHLIIPDLPGFGVSPLPDKQLTLEHLGKLLIEFIDALHLSARPHLVGHSMGSLVVAEAVRQKKNICDDRLILISPVPTPVGILDSRFGGAALGQLYYTASHRIPIAGHRIAKSKMITRLSTRLIMSAREANMRRAIYSHHFDNLRYISNVGWYKRLHRQINRTGISRYQSVLKNLNILLINGDKDSVTPLKHQLAVVNNIRAKLVVIKNVGHLAHYETPLELATEIRNFLR